MLDDGVLVWVVVLKCLYGNIGVWVGCPRLWVSKIDFCTILSDGGY